jgi:hypothetical protein
VTGITPLRPMGKTGHPRYETCRNPRSSDAPQLACSSRCEALSAAVARPSLNSLPAPPRNRRYQAQGSHRIGPGDPQKAFATRPAKAMIDK